MALRENVCENYMSFLPSIDNNNLRDHFKLVLEGFPPLLDIYLYLYITRDKIQYKHDEEKSSDLFQWITELFSLRNFAAPKKKLSPKLILILTLN